MIEHTTLLKDAGLTSGDSNPSIFISALNTILSAYTWKSNSSVNETSSLTSTYGNYYFTGNSYIKIDYFANNQSYLGINLITPNGTKRVQFTVGGHCTISVGKTDKGICVYVPIRVQVAQENHAFITFMLEKSHCLTARQQLAVYM